MSFRQGARYPAAAAMSLLYFLLMAGTFNSLGVVLPLMVTDLGMNWAEAGFGFTLLGISCGIASLVPAILIRHIGISRTLLVGSFTLALGFASLGIARSALAYHVGTTLMGLGFCFCGTVPGIHVISSLFERRRSTALGAYFTIGGLGSVAGPLLFYAMNGLLGEWRMFWVGCAVAALVLGTFAAVTTSVRRLDGDRPAAARDAPGAASGWSARAALRSPKFWIVVAAYTTCLLVNTTVHSFAVQHLGERGLSLGKAAGLISFAALIGALASSLAGVLGERFSARSVTLLALGALGFAAAMLVVPQGVVSLGLFGLSVGVGLGVSYVGTAMLLLDWFGSRANLELYSVMCVVSTSAAVGPAIGGMQRDASGSFVSVFGTLAVIAVAVFAVLLATRRPAATSGEPRLAASPQPAIMPGAEHV